MSLRKEIAKFHTVVFTRLKRPGVPARGVHVLYLFSPAGPKALLPFIDFVIETGRGASLSWQKNAARALGLLIDFLTANADALKASKYIPKPLALFAEALVYGTIDLDGFDASGLFWEPKAISRARRILNTVSEFGDWVANRLGTENVNPWRDATVVEQIAFWRHNDQRRSHALLGYVNSANALQAHATKAKSVVIGGSIPKSSMQEPKVFPRDRFGDLLFDGFKIRGKEHETQIQRRLNIRDALITILLHGGGLRESEPFHLFVSDVCVNPKNPNSALVKLFHPVDGSAPADFVDPLTGNRIGGTREQYLREKWQLEPRNRTEGRFKAGWKDLLLSNKRNRCTYVYWFPSFWGEVFMTLFKIYITQCRSCHCNHPYLFVSEKEEFAGCPYTIDSFRQAHARAVARIGLVPLKENGTTPHGHRHAFGQNLADAGTEPMIIQQALHQKSLGSQESYTAAAQARVFSALARAEKVLSQNPTGIFLGEDQILNRLKLAA